jgi:hypothetical protein
MDYNNKVIYGQSGYHIFRDVFGKEHKFYQFPKYIKQNFEENQIMPNVVSSFINIKLRPRLLSKMIQERNCILGCVAPTIAMLIRWDIQRAVRMV